MRLRGKGESGGGAHAKRVDAAGDLLLTVHVAPHPFFTRKGNDLYVRLPVTLGEAAAGATVDVPTPSGTVALHIPPGTSSGKRLRVKGHGVPAKAGAGDLFAEALIVLPANMTDADREAIRAIEALRRAIRGRTCGGEMGDQRFCAPTGSRAARIFSGPISGVSPPATTGFWSLRFRTGCRIRGWAFLSHARSAARWSAIAGSAASARRSACHANNCLVASI